MSVSGWTGRRRSRRSNDRPLVAEASSGSTRSDWIDGIVVAAPPEWEEPCILVAEEVARRQGRRDASRAARAAASRFAAALAEVPEEATVVLVHDAARPLVTDEVIERVITALARGLGRGRSGLCRSPTPSSASTARPSSRRSTATASSRCRPRRRSSRRSSETRCSTLATDCCKSPTARRSSKRAAAGCGSSRAIRACSR